mmetsp:Transcript_36217/g.41768  ORF Transcript_36217/g.41768 Transcript_36217/m.41768 type:complete len:152 (+) Transcript_36217:174-629(+)
MHKTRIKGLKIRVEKAMTSKSKISKQMVARNASLSSDSSSFSDRNRKHRNVADENEESKSLLSSESYNPRIRDRDIIRDESAESNRRERALYDSDIKDYSNKRSHHFYANENKYMVDSLAIDFKQNRASIEHGENPTACKQGNRLFFINYK